MSSELLQADVNSELQSLSYEEEQQEMKAATLQELASFTLRVAEPHLEYAIDSAALDNQIMEQVWYHDDIVIEAYETDEQLTNEEIINSMETNHAVKLAPRFQDQKNDTERTQLVSGYQYTEERGDELKTLTEHQALQQLDAYLQAAEAGDLELRDSSWFSETAQADMRQKIYDKASDLRENLTFIGGKEYQEAASGIATYWKALLDKNPDQQIYAATRWLHSKPTLGGAKLDEFKKIKSNDYMLDSVLGNFSDEELVKYSGRLVADEAEIIATSSESLRVVFLDDWAVSGNQLTLAASNFVEQHPELARSVEVQLIATSQRRLKAGLVGEKFGNMDGLSLTDSLPVRAYYVANDAAAEFYGRTRISGAHSSVDYNFHDDLHGIFDAVSIPGGTPLLTDVERPYRQPDYQLTAAARLQIAKLASADS